jgi:pimeloyl-ACP methyl ester carboxylesterase
MIRRAVIGCGGVVLFIAIALLGGAWWLLHRTPGFYFDSDGVRIFYTVQGKGEPLILIHGMAVNGDLNWRRTGVAGALAKHFQVIALDCRGYGLSDKPAAPGQYGLHMADDVTRLMDHLKIKDAHMAGYSMGGFILIKLMIEHPERVRSAVICAAGWKDPNDPSPIPDPHAPPSPAKQAAARSSSASPHALGAGDWINDVREWARSRVGDRLGAPSVNAAVMQDLPALYVSKAQIEANKVPCAVIIGGKDGLLPLALALRAHMANLEYIELPAGNHFTSAFLPAFRQEVEGFFLRHRAVVSK